MNDRSETQLFRRSKRHPQPPALSDDLPNNVNQVAVEFYAGASACAVIDPSNQIDQPPQSAVASRRREENPEAADVLAKAVEEFPEPGSNLDGFHLLRELGKGAFGRVYLARQLDLSNRLVVLKITPDIFGEAQTLAQLQHTNVVPVYSVRRSGPFQIVCMPFLGNTTLNNILQDLRGSKEHPRSGFDLISTIVNRRFQTKIEVVEPTIASRRSNSIPQPELNIPLPAVEESAPLCVVGPSPILELLRKFDYQKASLWIGSRLAEGLAHAHERGILHRDIKPANILISDEGQPLLLDFGVAEDTKSRMQASVAWVGGTLAYMAPEHLQALLNPETPVTQHSDIYSLGIVLFELLTLKRPFSKPDNSSPKAIGQMIAERQGPLPSLRQFNKAITPGIESIIHRCLAPNPADRYQDARQLQEDLTCQLHDKPLRYAPEKSLHERFTKWTRRHPRLTSSTTVGIVAGIVLLSLLGWLWWHAERLGELQASEAYRTFHQQAREVQLLLTARFDDREQVQAGIRQAEQLLTNYLALENPSPSKHPEYRRLPTADQEKLSRELVTLTLLLARGTALHGSGPSKDRVERALALNQQAEQLNTEYQPNKAILLQRADLLDMLLKKEEAAGVRQKADLAVARTPEDCYLAGTELATLGRYREAIVLLEEAVALDPQDFWSWFMLGSSNERLGQTARAINCYSAAHVLWPEFPWARFNRGLVRMQTRDFADAEVDFAEVIKLRPDYADAYLNRGIARQNQRNFKGAIADYSQLIKLDPDSPRGYFLRSRMRMATKDAKGAREDLDKGLKCTPKTEQDWIARGAALLSTNLNEALAAFNKALKINPRSLPALQNSAHVLGRTGKNAEAIARLDQAVSLYPDFVPSRAARGVYHARLKHHKEALADAEESLLRNNTPSNLYQVAGIYALTSQGQPQHKKEAYRLLTLALRKGFGFELLEIDRELDPLRKDPEFRKLIEASRSIK